MSKHLSCRVLLCVLLSLVGCTDSFNKLEQPVAGASSTTHVDSTTRAYPLFSVEEIYNGKVHVDAVTSEVEKAIG